MGLSFINLLVGLAGWANTPFKLLDEPKDEAPLLGTRPFAEGTFKALLGQLAVFFSNRIRLHGLLLIWSILLNYMDILRFAHILEHFRPDGGAHFADMRLFQQ